MHARVTRMESKPGKVDEIVRISREVVVPEARRQAGLVGVVQLVDRARDRAVSITFWASEAELRAGEESGYYAGAIASVAELFAAPYEREVWEVSISEFAL